MSKNAVHEFEREVRTYADLKHGADVLIKKAEQDQTGSYYTAMSALLLTAFTFEAYLNHLLREKIAFYEEIDSINVTQKHNVNVTQKHNVVRKTLGLHLDISKRPHQTIQSLFKFRNAIAHGKSVILEGTEEVDSQTDLRDLQPKAHWEEYCSLENAKRAHEDICTIIAELHRAAGLGEYPFMHGMGIGSLSLKSDP